jgi:two-component sensor histidine kinase
MALMHIASKEASDTIEGLRSVQMEELPGRSSDEFIFVQEILHRVNNQLASTIGFVSQIAAHSTNCDVKVALAGVMEHLLENAGVYRALQMPTENRLIDVGTYLRELCQAISRAKLRHNGINLTLLECPLELSSAQCWKLGLIVAELITNCCRHAFSDGGGSIKVEFKKSGSRVECRVTDDGSARENIRAGQGLKIVQHLTHGLDGGISQSFSEKGSIAIVFFPDRGIDRK